MKKGDIVKLIVGLVVLSVAGIFLYSQFAPAPSSVSTITVDKIRPIDSDFNNDDLNVLKQQKSFSTTIDLGSGIGNPNPFGH